jgi:hypothetical protein
VLWRDDSAFDSARLLFAKAADPSSKGEDGSSLLQKKSFETLALPRSGNAEAQQNLRPPAILISVSGMLPVKITLEARKYSLGCYNHGFWSRFCC